MRTTITIDLTRDALVAVLVDYLQTACPSALLNVIADAFARASIRKRDAGSEADAVFLDHATGVVRTLARVTRAKEDEYYTQKV